MKAKAAGRGQSLERYMVPVVRSTFRILEELSRTGALGVNEVTQRTGVSKSTVFRVLTTLTQLGYTVRNPDREYRITNALSALVSDTGITEALRLAALPWMLKLRDEFGETVNLGWLQLDRVTYIEVVPSEFALRLHERPGASVCVHASALGKAILAFSPEVVVDSLLRGRELQMFTRNTITDPEQMIAELHRVHEHGYAFDRGETSLLATCVAAPIIDARGVALAALSVSGPTSRFNPRANSPVIESLLIAASEISKQFRARALPASPADVANGSVEKRAKRPISGNTAGRISPDPRRRLTVG
jgi:DNA-binding IclR family transcriptional regulator